MSTLFSTKKNSKNNFSKRVLGMESLENRELLSVSPLGTDFTPDFVQAASQDFSTEAVDIAKTYNSITVTLADTELDALYNDGSVAEVFLQYKEKGTTDGWADGGSYTGLNGVGGGTTSVTIDNLDQSTEYEFRFTKVANETGDASTNTLTSSGVTVVDTTTNALPALGTATAGSGQVSIAVTNSTNLTGTEEIRYRESSYTTNWIAGTNVKVVTTIVNPTVISSLTGGTEYEFAIFESSSATAPLGGATATVKATPSAALPQETAPSVASASGGVGEITVTLNAADPLLTYKLYDGTTQLGMLLNQSSTTLTFTGIPAGTYASLKLTAWKSDASTSESNPTTISSQTVTAPPLPGNQTGAAGDASTLTGGTVAAGLTTNSVTLTVLKVSNAKTYTIAVYTDQAHTTLATKVVADYVAAGNSSTTKTAIALTGLEANTQYYVMYSAFDKDGVIIGGAANDIGSFKTADTGTAIAVAAPAVSKIAATWSASGGLKITWTAPANYTGAYDVTVKASSDGIVWTPTADVVITPGKAEAKSAAAANNYYYQVTVAAKDAPTTAAAPTAIVGVGSKAIAAFVDSGLTNATEIKDATAATANALKITKVEVDAATRVIKLTGEPTAATSYLVSVQDATGIVYQTEALAANIGAALSGAVLVPGVKYDVIVTALDNLGGTGNWTKGAAVKGSFTVAKFADPKFSLDRAGLVGATLKGFVDTVATATNTKYFLEYTKIADAKGKADWSTATALAVTTTLPALPAIPGLDSGTQYYARLVAVNSSAANDGSNATSVVIGKEVKFKTVAAPAITISKSGFDLTSTDLAVKFTAKCPDQKGLVAADDADVNLKYTLIVSADAVIDKVTGKLSNGVSVGSSTAATLYVDPRKGTSTKFQDKLFDVTANFTGATNSVLAALTGKVPGTYAKDFKNLNVQLLVEYYDTTNVVTTAYTKVAKLALPKWYV